MSAWLSAGSEIVQASAAIAVAYAAVAGVHAWKKQKRYETHIDLAAAIAGHAFEVEERFAEARNPFGFMSADVGFDRDALEKYQRDERSQKLVALGTDFNSLVRAVAKADVWREKFCDEEMKTLRKRVGELNTACKAFYGWNWTNSSPEMTKLQWELHQKVWGTPDDDFGKVVVDNCEKIRAECRKLTR